MFLFLFLVLPNLYSAVRAFLIWQPSGINAVLFWVAIVALFLIQFLGIAGERTIFPQWKDDVPAIVPFVNWTAYGLYGFVTVLTAYFLVGDVIRIVWHLISVPENPENFDRRLFMTLGLGALATTAIGIVQAAKGPTVKRVIVPIANLPAAFDGFTIAQISDLHAGPTIKRPYTENVVSIVNGLNPDMVALTGDFVDGAMMEASTADVEPLRNLRSTYGSYYVTGNHEYYWGADAWMAYFKTLGIHVLANRHETIERGGDALVIAGVNDYATLKHGYSNACDPKKALEGAPEEAVKILLAHQPVTYTLYEGARVDIQLSGHTHAGQYFPFNLLIPLFQKYYKGLNRHENTWIYVNSATGYWGPPLRTSVPTEITHITLKRAS